MLDMMVRFFIESILIGSNGDIVQWQDDSLMKSRYWFDSSCRYKTPEFGGFLHQLIKRYTTYVSFKIKI